jgi:hypothetical protein
MSQDSLPLASMLSKPLIPFPIGVKGGSSSVASIPIDWNMHARHIITRLSSDQLMMNSLAENFRRFIGPDLQPIAGMKPFLNYCFGEWNTAERSMFIGYGKTIDETDITALHSKTIFFLIPMIFQHLVENDERCQMLRDRGVTLSCRMGDQPISSGKADRGFCLEVPENGDSLRKTVKCCWFDDKNPGVMETHEDAMSTHIKNGHTIKCSLNGPTPMKLLAKVIA